MSEPFGLLNMDKEALREYVRDLLDVNRKIALRNQELEDGGRLDRMVAAVAMGQSFESAVNHAKGLIHEIDKALEGE